MRKKKLLAVVLVLILLIIPFYKKANNQNANKVNYIYVTVESGDTLWKIAKKHKTDKQDIRKLVYEIRKANNLESLIIYPGQTIKVPIEVE
ncbi:MAG: LysM peptidoglycan-binding domain-containing protein [Caloramator sp.]|nr:LysM peptidoglycan-binding domain-containing protein [Caloramator sp.]